MTEVAAHEAEPVGRYANVNGVRLHYVEVGTGPLVVLLHGFPQFWYAWRHQIGPLATAGFRVVAPDMRGYNLSAKPRGVEHYGVDVLARDVAGLVEALGVRSAAIVGHDWGGTIAWHAAARYPARVRRLAVLNGPNPRRYVQALRRSDQLRRSWYVGFFQLPWIPELLLRRATFAAVEAVLRTDPVRPGAFSEEDIRRHKEALAEPGALTAAINYYRALLRAPAVTARDNAYRVEQPVLVIWGDQDRYLDAENTRGLERWVPRVRVAHVAEASHWVMADAPQRVNELLVEFLRADA